MESRPRSSRRNLSINTSNSNYVDPYLTTPTDYASAMNAWYNYPYQSSYGYPYDYSSYGYDYSQPSYSASVYSNSAYDPYTEAFSAGFLAAQQLAYESSNSGASSSKPVPSNRQFPESMPAPASTTSLPEFSSASFAANLPTAMDTYDSLFSSIPDFDTMSSASFAESLNSLTPSDFSAPSEISSTLEQNAVPVLAGCGSPVKDNLVVSDSDSSVVSGSAKSEVSRSSKSSSGKAKHVCEHCGKAFDRRYNLKSHISAKHLHEKPFACHHCPKSFSRKHDLARHFESRHEYTHKEALLRAGQLYPSSVAASTTS